MSQPEWVTTNNRDVTSGWASLSGIGISMNLILTGGGGADCAHHITACPPLLENLTISLKLECF